MKDADPRTALIDAAVAELASVVPAVGARAIARKAGVNHGLVPYYYENAAGLLVAAVEEATARYLARFEALLTECPDGGAEPSGPAAIVPRALGVLRDDPDHFARRRAIVALAKDDADVARCARSLVDTEIRLASTFVAMSRGREIATQEDECTACLIVALFDGIAAQAAVGVAVDEDAVAEAVDRLIDTAHPTQEIV